ncbi:uncharacterized protein LOC121384636 isoform X2 [Gigantopelta aegis]|nr:uncharacterized protein LOC121384636 isoform X2 [Gigantopelta aegis]
MPRLDKELDFSNRPAVAGRRIYCNRVNLQNSKCVIIKDLTSVLPPCCAMMSDMAPMEGAGTLKAQCLWRCFSAMHVFLMRIMETLAIWPTIVEEDEDELSQQTEDSR